MPLISSTIPNLVSGVSQQPASSRLRTSGEHMENCFPSIVSGLLKRPPSEFVASLTSGITESDAAVHVIDRSVDEKYILIAGNQTLEMYSAEGVAQTISFPDGTDYLDTDTPNSDLRFVTVADTTFVLNTSVKTVASSLGNPETRPDPAEQASVFIKRAVASVTYAVYIDDVLAGSFSTSSNVDAASALEGTAEIAREIAADCVTNGHTGAYAEGTTVIIPITAGQVVKVDDEYGGGAMEAYTTTLQAFEDLPPREAVGRLVKIQGDIETSSTAYWVEYTAEGVWKETFGWNEGTALHPELMPHVLVRTGETTFEFREAVWPGRTVGDAESNPSPSFVNKRINNMFLFKGRLGFLSEENVILSEAGVLENFYLTTVVQPLSSDMIDVASATGRVATLYHAVSFADELVLFSDKRQFRLTSGAVLSGETVGITASTVYPCSIVVNPVTVGSSAFFLAEGPSNASVRELIINPNTESVEAEDVSIQVPRYIPSGIKALAGSSSAEMLVALPSGASNELYVYKWYTSGGRKVQSAWSKWVFDEHITIVGIGFLGDYLQLIYKVGGELRIDKLNVNPIIEKDLLLDHQITQADFASMNYDDATGLTTLELPWAYTGAVTFYNTTHGNLVPYTAQRIDDTTYTIKDDVTYDQITAGINYEMLYEFSTQFLREEDGDGESVIQDGRLQLLYMSVVYSDTSYFETHVAPRHGDAEVTTFNGRTVDNVLNVTDRVPRVSGGFKFPIFSKNDAVTIQLRSNQPYHCAFTAVEWTAMYNAKARRT